MAAARLINSMKLIAYALAILCVILCGMYLLLPGGSLPQFLPGFDEGSTHIHMMHAVAAATAAVVFC
jgi:hypothetical protein